MGDLSLLLRLCTYSVIYLHHHGLMGIYLFLNLHSNTIIIYSVAQLLPTLAIAKTFQVGSYALSMGSHPFKFLIF